MAALRPFSFVSSRLQFRRFARGEEATILTIRNEINALKYLPWWTTLSSEQGGSYVERQTRSQPGNSNEEAHMAVVDRQTSKIIAICFLKVDGSGLQGGIGLMLCSYWRGKGLEQEILRSLGIWAKSGSDGPRVQRVTVTLMPEIQQCWPAPELRDLQRFLKECGRRSSRITLLPCE